MNIPFPVIYPQLIGPDWFHADQPCDEDAELTQLERANEQWLNSIGKQYMKHAPAPLLEKPHPGPAATEEAVVSDDDANDDAEESEDSHDVDEEDMPTTDSSPPVNNDGESESPEDNTEAADLEDEATLWPYVNQNE